MEETEEKVFSTSLYTQHQPKRANWRVFALTLSNSSLTKCMSETAVIDKKEVATSEWNKNDKIVKKGMKAFVEVGLALAKIKKEKLYKEGGFESFRDYVADRIDMSEQQARKVQKAAEIANDFKLAGVKELPTHESQIRALSKLKESSQRKEVWIQAVETAGDGVVSAKHVLNTAKRLYPHRYEPTEKAKKREAQEIRDLKKIRKSLEDAGLTEALELFNKLNGKRLQ